MILSVQSSEEAIAAAKRALDHHKQFWFGSVKVESEFYDLGIMTKEERLMAVDIALLEITAQDRLGPEPPGNVSHPSSPFPTQPRSEEHTSELQSLRHLVCRLLLE